MVHRRKMLFNSVTSTTVGHGRAYPIQGVVYLHLLSGAEYPQLVMF